MKHIAVDLGGTKIEIILCGENVLNILERKRVPTQQYESYERLLRQIAGLIKEYLELSEDEMIIGMGIPGSISPQTGAVLGANTQCLNGQPLQSDLESLTDHQIFIENDANCFALSEALMGAGQGYEAVLGIIMGTGVGGGAVYSGKLWKGANGNASEWGHQTLKSNGIPCWCGRTGCMENYISGIGIERIYKKLSGQDCSLPEIYQKFEEENNPHAQEVIQNLISDFADGVSNLITIFDPSIIIVGGGVSNLPILYSEGANAANQKSFHPEFTIPIVKNKLGDSSGIYGAAMLTE